MHHLLSLNRLHMIKQIIQEREIKAECNKYIYYIKIQQRFAQRQTCLVHQPRLSNLAISLGKRRRNEESEIKYIENTLEDVLNIY